MEVSKKSPENKSLIEQGSNKVRFIRLLRNDWRSTSINVIFQAHTWRRSTHPSRHAHRRRERCRVMMNSSSQLRDVSRWMWRLWCRFLTSDRKITSLSQRRMTKLTKNSSLNIGTAKVDQKLRRLLKWRRQNRLSTWEKCQIPIKQKLSNTKRYFEICRCTDFEIKYTVKLGYNERARYIRYLSYP